MPQAKTVVLDISESVSPEDYARTLNALKDGMDNYRESQGWCTEFWSYITNTISGAFRWDSYNETVTVRTDTVSTDTQRATELRNIRGRILAYVGERIQLDPANRILRDAGLAEYTRTDDPRTPWRVQLPSVAFTVHGKEDPTVGIQAQAKKFLASVGDADAEYHGGRAYASETTENYRVPTADTVRLLDY